ncbi:MAG: prolyl-tRNA synthetase associated domain-containing protein [Clostridia bacterium]|nr:prolyl-tRNA synthetase associated domain-containing protein [Clostridia bacterium]
MKPENFNVANLVALRLLPPATESEAKNAVYAKLNELDIPFYAIDHPPVHGADCVENYVPVDEHTVVVKNLYLRNDTGTKTWLVTECYHKHADLVNLRAFLGSSRLGFCSPERLWTGLGIRPGSVSPLCCMNDTEGKIPLILDADLASYAYICMHPNDNTGSVYLKYEDLLKFARATGHEPIFYRV